MTKEPVLREKEIERLQECSRVFRKGIKIVAVEASDEQYDVLRWQVKKFEKQFSDCRDKMAEARNEAADDTYPGLLSIENFERWLELSGPGDKITYARSVPNLQLNDKAGPLRRVVADAHETYGEVMLFQKKVREDVYDYIAVRVSDSAFLGAEKLAKNGSL